MPKAHRTAARLFAALALVALLQPLTYVMGAAAGRDYPRCIHACNETRQLCTDRCSPDCTAMFPNDPARQSACVSACKDVCVSESKDCKLVCRAIKNGETFEEP